MSDAHDKWKKQQTEQGQLTLEEIGIDLTQAIQVDPEWWAAVSRQRYSGQNLKDAFQLGLESALVEDPQEEFEQFVEKLAGVKRAAKRKREAAKARRK